MFARAMTEIVLLLILLITVACSACCAPVTPLRPEPDPSESKPTIQRPSPAPELEQAEEPALSGSPEYPEQPQGKTDPDIVVEVYDPEKAYNGTTLIPDNHDISRPRIIEVNMRGEVVWEYVVPNDLKRNTNPGFDAEMLHNGNIMAVFANKGVYEINREGNIVWSYLTSKISHDADRLPDGNTLFVYGNNDRKSDAQVTEVDPQGKVVWQWRAADYFDKVPYRDISDQGWTHTNGVFRMSNGNTLVSPRNFDLVIEVSPQGKVVNTNGEGVFSSQHDPEFLDNGNIIAALQWRTRPHKAVEFDINTGTIIWEYAVPQRDNWPVRDANRLPNGNTLITGSQAIIEVTSQGEIVWLLRLEGVSIRPEERSQRGFYKAQRITG